MAFEPYYTCDFCDVFDGVKHAGTTRECSLDGKTVLAFDACDEVYEKLFGPLLAALMHEGRGRAIGRVPDSGSQRPAVMPARQVATPIEQVCPECGIEYSKASAARNHVLKNHGIEAYVDFNHLVWPADTPGPRCRCAFLLTGQGGHFHEKWCQDNIPELWAGTEQQGPPPEGAEPEQVGAP